MKRVLYLFAISATVIALDLEAILKTSNDRFSADMFQEVVKSQGNKSCVLSAFSVLSPLAELALASVGESHDQILKTIGLPNSNITKQVFSKLNAKLRLLKEVDLEITNKIYVRKDYLLNDTFAAVSKNVFNSEIENIDFQQKNKAAAEINTWVEDHTHKHVKNLVNPDSLDENTAAILINAIYFKGNWKKPFMQLLTQNKTFHVTKDLKKPVPMMYQTEEFKYAESKVLDAKFLEMEYAGGETSLVVVLPNKIDGINELIAKIKDPSALNQALKEIYPNSVSVYLPKFKIDTTTNLGNVLKKMNVTQLFQEKHAKLYNLLKERKDLYISSATQKAFIEVNEEGSEAAISNSFYIVNRESLNFDEDVREFKADHPFLFFLMEQNNILFSGVYRS